MGIVYKARDPSMGRLVALKTITGSLKGDPELFARFCQEARSAGALEHPNIVTIYELSTEGETPYIAMAYLEGESLEKVVARRQLIPISQKLGYMVQVCRALDYAHQHGVIHRDIKPGNVMVTSSGVVKVVDFGIAHLADASKTSTGMIIGTFAYMSPQQLGGERADERFDIWAAGVMFYELLAYQRPFFADTQAALITSILTQEPRNLQEFVSGCPPEVNSLVWKMLRKQPPERYQTFQEVLIDLEPLWKRTAQEAVANLVSDSAQLFECRDYQKAQELLRSALQIDSQATQAKALLERVNAEIRRIELLPRVKEKLAKAQQLLEGGELEQAKLAVESVLQMDSRFQPARDLLAQVEEARKREEQIRQVLHVASQRFAEGALTEVLQHVEKVFQLDVANVQAQELKRKVQEEAIRRERRKKLLETLHIARSLWAQLRYDECIDMLVAAQKDFPGDAEIMKLLETARQDHAEQQRQQQLKEARNLLAQQHLDEALAILDTLLQSRPSDPTALSLRTLVMHEREVQARQERLHSEMGALRTLINQSKYDEALRKGEDLRGEFPQEVELNELLEFARAQAAQITRKRSLEEKRKTLEQHVAAGQWQQALAYAEKALLEFPGNVDILALQDRAQQAQKQQERHTLLERRIREIKGKVRREEFTDAIDLAQQTLFSAGPDTDVQQLLNLAKKEYEEREKKRGEQEAQLQAARASLQSGDLDGATRILDQGLATRMFNPADERVRAIFTEIQTSRMAQRRQPPKPAPAPSTGTGKLGKDYAYQPAGPPAGTPPPAPGVGQDATLFASGAAVGAPEQAAAAPAPAPVELPREVPPEQEWSATRWAGAPAAEPPATVKIPLTVETPEPEAPKPTSKKPMLIAAAVLVAIVVAIAGYVLSRPGKQVSVHFEADPAGADVSVKGAHCQAPCDLKLAPGNYTVSATYEGYDPLQTQISVGTTPEPISLKLTKPTPAVGTLVIQANVDQVNILVDGVPKRVTTGTTSSITLLVGSHEIRAEKPGYDPAVQTIEVKKDAESKLALELRKASAATTTATTATPPQNPYLIIASKAGARVEVDRKGVGQVQGDGTYSLQVAPGKHRVDVILEGYDPWSTTVTAKAGGNVPISAELRARPKAKPAIMSFIASNYNIHSGQSADLRWDTQNATEVSIDPGIGSVRPSDSRQVSPSASTTYTLTAKSEGQVIQRSITINVTAVAVPAAAKPSVITFVSGSDKIQQGESTKLMWATQNATDVSISELGAVETSGSRAVSPSKTTDYVLTAKGAGESITKSVRVTVEAAPHATTPAATTTSSKEWKVAIDRYKDAWESMSIEELRKAWPSMPKNKEKDIKAVFNQFKAIRVSFSCADPSPIPSIAGADRVQCSCTQNFTYTSRDGKVQPTVRGSSVFHLKKIASTWYVDDVN